jgi:hypothetical protein
MKIEQRQFGVPGLHDDDDGDDAMVATATRNAADVCV